MSANTIKLASQLGEIYIPAQQTKSYKNIMLFGYGYLDWGRIVNQSLVTLIDKIDTIDTNGMGQVTFDLETYTEAQKVLRTNEFITWKSEYKQILLNTVNEFIITTNASIEDVINAQNIINTSVTQELTDFGIKLEEDYNTLASVMENRISEVVNANLESIIIKVNDSTDAVTRAINNLDAAKLSIEQKTVEFSNLFENFKSTFQVAFDAFKLDTSTALEDNKTNIIQYVNEKLLGYGTSLGSHSDRLDRLEIMLEGTNIENLQLIIIDKVNEITTNVVNSTMNGLLNRLNILETFFTDIDQIMINKIGSVVDSKFQSIDGLLDSLEAKFITYDSAILDIHDATTSFRTWIRDFDNMIEQFFINKDNFIEEIEIMRNDNMLTDSTISESLFVNKKGIEATIKQTDKNTKNILNDMNKLENSFIAGLRNTSFDENSLIRDISYRKDLLINNLNFYTFNDVFRTNEFKIMDIGIVRNIDEKICFMFIVLKLPTAAFSAPLYSTKQLQVNFNNMVIDAEGNKYFEAPIFKMNRRALILGDIGAVLPNYETVVNDLTIGSISDTFYYTDTNTTDLISISIPEIVPLVETTPITLTFNGMNISFKLSELIASGTNNIFNLVNDNTKYHASTQTILNNRILPFLPMTESYNTIDIPLKKVVSLQNGKEFHIKVNLPTNSTMTNIIYNDGSTSVTKVITNRNNFERDITTAGGWGNSYYKDISTTGVLKFPVNNSTTKVTGTINYKIGTSSYSENFVSGGDGGGDQTILVEETINKNTFHEIDTNTLFGSVDARRIDVDLKVLDTTAGSDTLNMWINGNNIGTVVIRDNRYIRIYNEYTENLSFFILLTNR